MKFRRIAAALAAASIVISLSACQSNSAPGSGQEAMETVESIEDQVTAANSTAASIKNQVLTFLTKMDTQKCGMKMSDSFTSQMTISVENGVWKVTNSTPDSFLSGGKYTWSGSGSSDSTSEDIAEDELARSLAEVLPNVTTGGIAVWLEGGRCMAVSFTADSVYPDAQTLEMMGKGGWTADTCEWDGKTAGVSKDGNIVGTSPLLDIKG